MGPLPSASAALTCVPFTARRGYFAAGRACVRAGARGVRTSPRVQLTSVSSPREPAGSALQGSFAAARSEGASWASGLRCARRRLPALGSRARWLSAPPAAALCAADAHGRVRPAAPRPAAPPPPAPPPARLLLERGIH
ncbi:hypothetical protein VULLAG_LOCUS4354 [Vulpes lagopus]